MVTGTTHRVRQLSSAKGRTVTLTVLRPEDTPANRAALRNVERTWRAQARTLIGHPLAMERAHFAVDVAYLASIWLSSRCILIGQDQAGAVLAVAIYEQEPGGWHLAFLTTDPANQGGNPNPDKIRGIGAEMLGAMAQDMATTTCGKVRLEPKDDKAASFWRHMGFHGPDSALSMTCPEVEQLAARLRNTPHEDPDAGGECYADCRALRRAVSFRA